MPEILPEKGKRNILITSALPYVNNVPHLGNIIGSVLSADVFSRYSKARPGVNALFICGTDEYGTATEYTAKEKGVTCQELCDKYNKIHGESYEWFNIAFDKWGRTPTTEQTEIAQDIFLKLWKNGYLEEQTSTQPYCEKHESFLADRFIEGECPICHYEDARGDQCDKCGNLMDPDKLINPRCKVDGATPILRDTKHVYLSLDKLQPLIEKWSKEAYAKGHWSSNGVAITTSWLTEGLKPRAITRDLKWGTAVPSEIPGYENKVLYVWFDACIGYVSITATYTKEWEKWWKNPDDVELYQFMGKDNVPFHSVIFPGSQIGTGENWTKVNTISTTEYLTYEGGKFSKSRGIGVFGNQAKETGLPADTFRYYLLSRRPETSDTDFDWKSLIDAHNNELKNNLGNLVNRILVFVTKKYDGKIPDYTKYTDPSLTEWINEVHELLKEYNEAFEGVRIRYALSIAMRISAQGNKLLQSNTLDNKTFASEPEKIGAVLGLSTNLILLVAAIIRPFIPEVSNSIARQLGIEPVTKDGLLAEELLIGDQWTRDFLKPGHQIGEPARLFEPIDVKMEDVWRDEFGGEEVRKAKEEKRLKTEKRKADKEKKKAKKAATTVDGGVEEVAKKVDDLKV